MLRKLAATSMISCQNNLVDFNTLKIKSEAKKLYIPQNMEEFISLLKEGMIVIGAGSNILFSSSGVEEPVVCTKSLDKIDIKDDIIKVECGYKTQKLSKTVFENGLSGFEFLIGIPATVGGAIYMNASAHNQCISDFLVSAEIFDTKTKKVLNLKKEELDFSYRNSILKHKPYILLSAIFKLPTGKKEDIKALMDENIAFRKAKQPNLSLPNAGSVFKNPINMSAGKLIDECGFRGYKKGDAIVYENHCNFIINQGNATSLDYSRLIYEIYSKVKEKYNIELEAEIIYIGKMTDEEKEIWKVLKKQPK